MLMTFLNKLFQRGSPVDRHCLVEGNTVTGRKDRGARGPLQSSLFLEAAEWKTDPFKENCDLLSHSQELPDNGYKHDEHLFNIF